MNSNPIGKNFVQAGLQAHEQMQEYMKDSSEGSFERHQEVFSEENNRARHLLHRADCAGSSTICRGETLIGPPDDQSIGRMMEAHLAARAPKIEE